MLDTFKSMTDPKESAVEAGLKYVSDQDHGILRLRKGKAFTYVDQLHKRPIKDKKILARIKLLVIPPAWQEVWICKYPNGHLQVTGRDVKKRKQYRYHEKWSVHRNVTKFTNMVDLGESLPLLRKRLEADLSLPGLPRDKILAAVIKVMLITQSRVGNAAYAEENESYGLTTLLNKHAKVKGSKVKLAFRGKSGVDHDISFVDAKLSRIIDRCQDLPGEELFAYLDDDGHPVDITSSLVNDYLHQVTGKEFTAKDLRTWGGTCKALEVLIKNGPAVGKLKMTHWKKRHLEVVRATATHLKNTVSVCRKYYINPMVFAADEDGSLHLKWKSCKTATNFTREEKLLMRLLSEDLVQKAVA